MSNKKICSTVCLSLVMTAGAVPAAAQNGFFIVGSVGHSATKLSPTPLPEIADEDQSLELGIGYAFNPYFAIQAGYQDFGQATETLELECPPGVACLPPEDCPPQSFCFIAVAPLLMQADIRGWSARLSGSFAGFASVGPTRGNQVRKRRASQSSGGIMGRQLFAKAFGILACMTQH